MLYREYKQRLEKRKNTIYKIWRFRYLVLTAFVLLATLIGVMIGITGNVYDVKCPETIEYGADYNIVGKAIFRKATVEYRKKGASDWSEEKPILVGDYEVRAVSTSAAGRKKVGKSASFSLVPKKADVSILGDSFIYGESPVVTASLVYGDRFTESHLEYEWNGKMACKVTPFVEKIVDENGLDVTEFYELICNAKDMTVNPRPITIQTDSATKVYDGTPLVAEGFSLIEGTLLDGETIQVELPAFQIDAAERQNIPEFAVLDKNGNNISECYDVSVMAGTLKVLPREIRVKTGSKTWIYDGEPHSFCDPGSYEVKGLLAGHSYELIKAVAVTDVTDTADEIGYRNNELTFRISDKNGEDISHNYAVSYEYGHLRIKTVIYISIYSIKKAYDGTPLQLGQGDYHVVKPPEVSVSIDLSGLSITEVGFIPLSAVYERRIRVEDAVTGEDVREDNRLEILGEADEPILEVEKRKIEVTSISITKVCGYRPLYGWEVERPAWISLGTLANGHSIEIEVTGVLDASEDSVENTISSVKIFDSLHNDITRYYDITLRFGILRWDEIEQDDLV